MSRYESDLISRLNGYSAQHEQYGGITAEAAHDVAIEKAISVLTEKRADLQTWIDCTPNPEETYPDICVYVKALNVAITALRAQQESEKGCKYCHDGEVIAWDMCNDAVSIESDGKIHILEAGDWECEINYCPMCGKLLRKERTPDENRRGHSAHGILLSEYDFSASTGGIQNGNRRSPSAE